MKLLKIWLDDLRKPPDETWVVCKTYIQAYRHITRNVVIEISFDHDLGTCPETGYTLACDIEYFAHDRCIGRIKWNVHSQNPVGAAKIKRAMKNADKYWDEWIK